MLSVNFDSDPHPVHKVCVSRHPVPKLMYFEHVVLNMFESRQSGSTSNFQPQVGGFNQKWCEVSIVTSIKRLNSF